MTATHALQGRIAGATGIASFCSCGLSFYGVNVDVADHRFEAHIPKPPLKPKKSHVFPGDVMGRPHDEPQF